MIFEPLVPNRRNQARLPDYRQLHLDNYLIKKTKMQEIELDRQKQEIRANKTLSQRILTPQRLFTQWQIVNSWYSSLHAATLEPTQWSLVMLEYAKIDISAFTKVFHCVKGNLTKIAQDERRAKRVFSCHGEPAEPREYAFSK